MKSILLRISDEMGVALDQHVGDVPRERWLRKLIAREIGFNVDTKKARAPHRGWDDLDPKPGTATTVPFDRRKSLSDQPGFENHGFDDDNQEHIDDNE